MMSLNKFIYVIISLVCRWSVIIHTSLSHRIVGVLISSKTFVRKWIGIGRSVNSFLNIANFVQASAILLWSSMSLRFPRFQTLPKYVVISSSDKISTLIYQHVVSFAPTSYPILFGWIFILSGWIFKLLLPRGRDLRASSWFVTTTVLLEEYRPHIYIYIYIYTYIYIYKTKSW